MYRTYIVGQAKTKGLVASTHGVQLDNAQQLHAYLVEHHSEVSSEQHERLHEVCNNFQNVPLQCLFSLPLEQAIFYRSQEESSTIIPKELFNPPSHKNHQKYLK